MKKITFLLYVIIASSLFTSCINNEIGSPSCVYVDKTTLSDFSSTSKIGETAEIAFEIINDCDDEYTILDFSISGDIPTSTIQGLIINSKVSSKKLPFKVRLLPKSLGTKNIRLTIITDLGQMVTSTNINVTND
jgi:hypothetical protein